MEYIQNNARRRSAYGKRRHDLRRKVTELSQKCGADAAVICLAEGILVNAYEHGHPSVGQVVEYFHHGNHEAMVSLYKCLALVKVEELDEGQVAGLDAAVLALMNNIPD